MKYSNITMLCPSHGRPDMASKLAESVIATRSNDSSVTLSVIVDGDDDSGYDERFCYDPGFGIGFEWTDMPTISLAWTEQAFRLSGNRLYRMTNDDEVCLTPGWDKRVIQVANEYPDGIFVLYVHDGFKGEEHCAFPIVSRKWIEVLGYFAPPYFEFGFNDTWIMDLAQRVGRLRYIPDVTIEHRHFTAENGYARDDTTDMNRRDGQAKRDKERFGLLEPIRELDAARLKQAMNG